MKKKRALLIISFGTSHKDTLEKTIEKIESKFGEVYKEYDVFRAFTSRIIVKKIYKRDGEKIFLPEEAMKHIIEQGYDEVLCQSLHIIPGIEYELTRNELLNFAHRIKILFSKPLMSTQEDCDDLAEIIINRFNNLSEQQGLVLMGHGTTHSADKLYYMLDESFRSKGHKNIWVATVEGQTTLEDILKQLKEQVDSNDKMYLYPFMIVAGEHAKNDMASNEHDSWKNILKGEGWKVSPILEGLGELEAVGDLFIRRSQSAVLLSPK